MFSLLFEVDGIFWYTLHSVERSMLSSLSGGGRDM